MLEGTYDEVVELIRMAKQYGRNPQYSGTVKEFARAIEFAHANIDRQFSFDAILVCSYIRNNDAVPHSTVLWFLGHVFDVESEVLGADEAVRLLHSRIAMLVHRKGEGGATQPNV